MFIAVRKELNGSIYFDKDFFKRYNDTELDKYKYTKAYIPDNVTDIQSSDFNDNLTFNIDKYNARIEKEQEERAIAEYENAIVSLIRVKYNLNQELAILRQRDAKPDEFAEYNAYVEQCKQDVKNNLTITNK